MGAIETFGWHEISISIKICSTDENLIGYFVNLYVHWIYLEKLANAEKSGIISIINSVYTVKIPFGKAIYASQIRFVNEHRKTAMM